MKTKVLLFTVALFGSAVTNWGQTVRVDGGTPLNIATLVSGALNSAKKLSVEGELSNESTLPLSTAAR